jgi:twitching motility two-component system response regulator PilH
MKVLIVDDDQLTAATWAMGLKSAGLEVITATNGQDGINQVKSQKPDMVLLDQIMPDMLGNAVLSQLKADPETSNIPVMLISNYNENQMMKEAIEKGAVDYVLKYQIETKDLVEKVKTLLSDLQSNPAPAQTSTTGTDQQTPANPITPETPAQNDNSG